MMCLYCLEYLKVEALLCLVLELIDAICLKTLFIYYFIKILGALV